jgi:hypothetical protein
MQAAGTDQTGRQLRRAYRALAATGLLALFAAHPATVSAAIPARTAPGLTVTGPQAISLNTAYVYRVTVLTNKSYRGAALWFSAGDCSQRRVIDLVAHRPWRGSFTTALSNVGFQLHPGVVASLVSPPTKGPPYAHTLFHRELLLSESATAIPASPPGSPERCQHSAGS